MTINLQQLSIFRAVVLAGSLSGAKRSTGLSQPAISQAIAKLEQHLDTTLIIRGRFKNIELTPSGEFWLKQSKEILEQVANAHSIHDTMFSSSMPILRFGTTPSLRGRFASAAARFAVEEGKFGRFELVFTPDSDSLIELMLVHKITAAVVNKQSLQKYEEYFNITDLFTEELVWAVPKSIPIEIVQKIINKESDEKNNYHEFIDVLNRHIEVKQGENSRIFNTHTDEWYNQHIPNSMPFFRSATYQNATDIVAEGLGTCHCPLTLLAGMSQQKLDKINWVKIGGIKRAAVLVMPRHLVSLPAFVNFRENMRNYSNGDFNLDYYKGLVNNFLIDNTLYKDIKKSNIAYQNRH